MPILDVRLESVSHVRRQELDCARGHGSRPRIGGPILAKAAASDDGSAESGTCLRSWCGYSADFLLLSCQHGIAFAMVATLYCTVLGHKFERNPYGTLLKRLSGFCPVTVLGQKSERISGRVS